MQKSERLLFAQTFFRAPRMLGSIVPSSRFLIENVLRAVDWERTRVVVEYGPGTGIFTREILARLRPDGMLLAIEHNQELYAHLRRSIRDRRLELFHGSAEDVALAMDRAGADLAHCIISGIPFSTLPQDSRGRIVRHSFASLDSGGVFLAYQFSGAVVPLLKKEFGNVEVAFEFRNFLPARIFRSEKRTNGNGLQPRS